MVSAEVSLAERCLKLRKRLPIKRHVGKTVKTVKINKTSATNHPWFPVLPFCVK